MQKWDYGRLDCELFDGIGRPQQWDGYEMLDWQNLSVMDVLKRLGNEGWELVGFSHDSKKEVWVFKRRKD